MKISINEKGLRAINETKKKLQEYGCSFQEYMRDCGRREDISLGEIIRTDYGIGIVVGWNRSCNYDVFICESEDILNFHPNEVFRLTEKRLKEKKNERKSRNFKQYA